MEIVFKAAQVTKSGDRQYKFIATDETEDRYGDIVEFAGWDFRNYKSNPIVLYQHMNGLPIGTATVTPDPKTKKVNSLIQLAAEGTSEMIDSIAKLLDQNILRAVSVGFLPTVQPVRRADPKTGGFLGYNFVGQELTEISIVSVPANPNATRIAKSLGIPDRQIQRLFAAPSQDALVQQAEIKRRIEMVRVGATTRVTK